MGFLDSIGSTIESGIQGKAEQQITKKIYGQGASQNKQANQNVNTTQNKTENVIKVTIGYSDKVVSIDTPSVSQVYSPDGTATFKVIGKPMTTPKDKK
ncbi:MAG: hypothetical protein ACP5M9_04495 [Candidatus Micrarchaeia archaeon]